MIDKIPGMSSVHSRLAVAASRMEGGELNTLLNDAIDEIERLRADRDRWKNLTKLARKSWVSDSWIEFLEQFDEAVCGE